MKRMLLFMGAIGLLTGGLLFTPSLATAQGALYELRQSLFGSGGTTSGGAYAMNLTVGDPVAGAVSGGAYSLGGGILGGGARVIAPVIPVETPAVIGNPPPAATATVAPIGGTGGNVKLYLPVVER